MHGTNLAAIDPVTQITDADLRERLAHVRFHPRTPAESLPFADGTIDFACSQFGLEYSDTTPSIPELARVLRRGGHMALIVHHQAASIVRSAREEARQRVLSMRQRLTDMQAAACTEDDIAALKERLDTAGFDATRTGVLEEERGAIAGWRIEATGAR